VVALLRPGPGVTEAVGTAREVRASPFVVSAIVIGGAAALFLFVPLAAAAPDPCQATLDFASNGMAAPVTSSKDGVASTGVEVHFQKPPGVQAVVELSASTDTGWPITVEPERYILDSGSVAYFFVSVTAPAATPAGEGGTVRAVASVAVGGYDCPVDPEATTAVTVLPYLDKFSGTIPVVSLDNRGDIGLASFDIVIEVRSNTVILVSIIFLADNTITVEAPSSFEFQPTFDVVGTRIAHVTLRAPGLRPGPHDVNITVRAQAADLPEKNGELGLTIYVPRGPAQHSLPWGDIALAVIAVIAVAAVAVVVTWRRRRRDLQ